MTTTLLAAAGTYLGNQPQGAVLFLLLFALILAIIGAVAAFYFKAFWAIFLFVIMALFIGAFMIKG